MLSKIVQESVDFLKQEIILPEGQLGETRRQITEVVEKAQGKIKEDAISDICIWLSSREEKQIQHLISSQISLLEAELERKKEQKLSLNEHTMSRPSHIEIGREHQIQEDITYLTEQIEECKKLLK